MFLDLLPTELPDPSLPCWELMILLQKSSVLMSPLLKDLPGFQAGFGPIVVLTQTHILCSGLHHTSLQLPGYLWIPPTSHMAWHRASLLWPPGEWMNEQMNHHSQHYIVICDWLIEFPSSMSWVYSLPPALFLLTLSSSKKLSDFSLPCRLNKASGSGG